MAFVFAAPWHAVKWKRGWLAQKPRRTTEQSSFASRGAASFMNGTQRLSPAAARCRRIDIIKTVGVFFSRSFLPPLVHMQLAHTHARTHKQDRFTLFLLPMWLFITTGRQPLFERSCQQQDERVLRKGRGGRGGGRILHQRTDDKDECERSVWPISRSARCKPGLRLVSLLEVHAWQPAGHTVTF